MSKEEFLKTQKCVLKVNIHCDGCKQKVKKILQKIDGVFKTEIDAEQGRVTVYGNVEPGILIKKLAKSGKHAELWPSQNPNNGNQMKNLQILKNALPKPSFKGGNEQAKNGGNALQLQQQLKRLEQIRGLQDLKLLPPIKDLKLPSKDQNPNQKSKNVELQEDDDDDYSDDDDLDDYDDEDYEDEEEEDYSDEDIQIPQMSGNMKKDGKNENGGNKSSGITTLNQTGVAGKNGSDAGGAKIGNNGGNKVNIDIKNGVQAMPNALQTLGAPQGGRMGNNPTVQGLPTTSMNGGGGGYPYFSGPGSMAGNPQQYIAAMVNQQRAMANQAMMYARPPAAVNYVPAYAYPTAAIPPADPYTHYFNDENTSSCNVM